MPVLSREPAPLLLGCDFSSRPGRNKQIVIAQGELQGHTVHLRALQRFASLDAFGHWLARPGEWVGGFDFPFGLPRELVEHLGWPTQWEACMAHYASLERSDIRALFARFCDARPVGGKFAHRATDRPARSSPSMKWVNPPVAYMLHAGVPLLLAAGVHIPGLHAGDPRDVGAQGRPRRVALEAYPGLLAREVLGLRSYKSDDRARQDAQRSARREELLDALECGHTRLGLTLALRAADRELLRTDASGDAIDAVLCLMQAAWGAQRGVPWFGLPPAMDPLEGWIVTA